MVSSYVAGTNPCLSQDIKQGLDYRGLRLTDRARHCIIMKLFNIEGFEARLKGYCILSVNLESDLTDMNRLGRLNLRHREIH